MNIKLLLQITKKLSAMPSVLYNLTIIIIILLHVWEYKGLKYNDLTKYCKIIISNFRGTLGDSISRLTLMPALRTNSFKIISRYAPFFLFFRSIADQNYLSNEKQRSPVLRILKVEILMSAVARKQPTFVSTLAVVWL